MKMGEAYTRLYSLPERLYTKGAPTVIAAGALLKDNRTGNILVQLKIQNICNKKIKAVTVKIKPMDTAGRELSEEIEYQYLDLNAARNEYFGQQVPIGIPNELTRSYSVTVTEVVFNDNSVWAEKGLWEPLEKQESAEKEFHDIELVRQYQIKYGKESKYLLQKEKDLWMCACGTLNHNDEERCSSCRTILANLEDFQLDVLKKECESRLEEERQKRERERAEAVEAEKRKQKERQKKIKLTVAVIVVVAVAAIAGSIVNSNLKKKNSYNEAVALMEEGKYSDSIELFTSLGEYKDSKDQINNVKYHEAEHYEEINAYEDALAVYEELGDYQDSKEKYQMVEKKAYPAKTLCDYIREKGTSGEYEINGTGCNVTGSCFEITYPDNPVSVSRFYTADSNNEEVWYEGWLEVEKDSAYLYLTLHLMYNGNEPKMRYTYYYEAKGLWGTEDTKYDGRVTISSEVPIAEYQFNQELTYDMVKAERFDPSSETWQEVAVDVTMDIASSIETTVQVMQANLKDIEITMADLGFNLEEETEE